MFCFPRETVKLLPPSDNLGGTFVGFTPLDRKLRSPSTTGPVGICEIVRGVVGQWLRRTNRSRPRGMPRMRGGPERTARQEQTLREIDGQDRLDCLWPLNLIALSADR